SNNYAMDFSFNPHITLARNPIMSKDSIINFKEESFKVNSFCLMKSVFAPKGMKYEIVKEFKLE
ncbi:MAG: hypothetical protein PHN56_06980, partial [Candidatus Nanoarchaeia archaeon]|nr:hypothetical protein [Candidatus Nanoarchaeia archaeon]